jgi:hypothetical protein
VDVIYSSIGPLSNSRRYFFFLIQQSYSSVIFLLLISCSTCCIHVRFGRPLFRYPCVISEWEIWKKYIFFIRFCFSQYTTTYPISVTNLLVSLSMDLFQVTFGCPIFLLPIGFQYIYCSFTCVYVYANVNDSVINISNDFYLFLLLSNTSLEIYLDKSCQY